MQISVYSVLYSHIVSATHLFFICAISKYSLTLLTEAAGKVSPLEYSYLRSVAYLPASLKH